MARPVPALHADPSDTVYLSFYVVTDDSAAPTPFLTETVPLPADGKTSKVVIHGAI